MTTAPRFVPLANGDWTAEHRALLRGKLPAADRYLRDDADGPPLPNILGLFGHHPQLTAEWLGWNARLLEIASLSPRRRELVILRVAWRTQCHYEWAQHRVLGLDAGLTEDEIAAIAEPGAAWSGVEGDLVDAADQMIDGRRVDDDTWMRLSEHFDHPQLLEVLFLIASYGALAQVLNSVHLPPDPGPDGLVHKLPEPEDRR
ncbi:MAG TPA: carboxymuconolactone decarboxylase family protein [Acidimicrobiales bacterium]|nr:carboxymuconolactone decarboxylase family protein [Acidimicrobiales bacterium]